MLKWIKIILVGSCLMPNLSLALSTSDWDVSLGSTTLSYSYDTFIREKIESSSVLEFSYNLLNTELMSAFNISFTEIFEGSGIPYSRLAIGARYYFSGFSGERVLYDSTVQARRWLATPFAGLNFGISNLSAEGFNASFVDGSLRGGVEIPLFTSVLLVGQISLGASLMSSSTVAEVSYSAMTLYAGLRFVDF